MMATVVAALGAVPILTMWTPIGPGAPVGSVISVVVTLCCGAMSMMWLRGWPSRRQSVWFILVANACIAASCLVYQSPGMSLLNCTAFAALAGYVAFFHTSRYLAFVLATAAATSVFCAVELAIERGALVALAKLVIIAVGVLAVPFSVHVLVHLLGDEALKSHTDPLTGLRNRRGFHRSARELIYTYDAEVNDTRGHACGDRILVAVADRLRRTTRGRAVVARVGGEEFLIAEMTRGGEAHAIAERLREEVAAIPGGATASVGVASIKRLDAAGSDIRMLLEGLVGIADAAMYEAKRAGGNQTRLAEGSEIHSG